MNKILKFDVFEKAQPEWFKKNPSFYLSRAQKEIVKNKTSVKKVPIDTKKYLEKLKTVKVKEIKFTYNEQQKEYQILEPIWLLGNKVRTSRDFKEYSIKFKDTEDYREIKSENNYKIILAFIKSVNKKTLTIKRVEKSFINPIFSELKNYYGLYYSEFNYDHFLFLTKDKEVYKKKVSELKVPNEEHPNRYKILYYNNKTQGKEFNDIQLLEVNQIKNELKNITVDDIYFTKDGEETVNEELFIRHQSYTVRFKNKELEKKVYKYRLIDQGFFTREDDKWKIYFGHLKNRYHTRSIADELRGIGLGYKIYKAFIKFNGYMVSDQQTSSNARKIYLNLMKDKDLYFIVDKRMAKKTDQGDDQNKIMLIWKDFPKMEQLVRIVRTHELRNKRKYEYDKELLPYIQNITKKTV